jgi:hypothetical protein
MLGTDRCVLGTDSKLRIAAEVAAKVAAKAAEVGVVAVAKTTAAAEDDVVRRFRGDTNKYADTFLDQGSRSERYLQIKAHFEV